MNIVKTPTVKKATSNFANALSMVYRVQKKTFVLTSIPYIKQENFFNRMSDFLTLC